MNAITRGGIITAASQQWASRPADQRFLTLHELQDHAHFIRDNARAQVISSRKLEAIAQPDHKGLLIGNHRDGTESSPTNWSFGQLATLASAPAGYLRKLPAELAADCVNYGLFKRDVEDVGVLLHDAESAAPSLAAATGPNYGRIWNSQIVDQLVELFGDGQSGSFRIPGEFGEAVAVTRGNTTLYASDRDMFVFLADESKVIPLRNRRNGETSPLARGFFVWNSEVGDAILGVATFLYDYACKNRIVWGARDYKEVKIRHSSKAPDRFLEDVAPALADYSESSTAGIVEAIENARSKRIDDVDVFLAKRQFSRSVVSAIKDAHVEEEGRPIETLWDATTAVTAYAKSIKHQNERVAVERVGGAILDLAQ